MANAICSEKVDEGFYINNISMGLLFINSFGLGLGYRPKHD